MMFNIHGLVNVEYLWETHFVLQLWKQQETKKKKKEKKAEVQVLVVIYFCFVSLI